LTSATSSFVDQTIATANGNVHLLHGGTGEPLVILHHDIGNSGWLPAYERLAQEFSVYVPDLPGFGDSDRPDWARHPRDLAILTNLLLDELNIDRVVLLGLGFGGWVAAEMATLNQRRFQRLVLVGAAGIQPREGQILDQIMVATLDYVRSGFRNAEAFEAQFGAEPSPGATLLFELNREMIARVTWKPYMFSDALSKLLPRVRIPTLIVWGEQDAVVPLECGQQYTDAFWDARLVVMPETGHFVDMERPDELARLIVEHVKGR
jgi:pimeloyl-ACP methyl ester carboxylesterase